MTSHKSGGRVLATFWIAVLLAVSLCSQHVALADPKEKLLTEAELKRFIASYPEVKEIVVSYVKENKKGVTDAKTGLAAVIMFASDKNVRGRIDTAVQAHGFSGSKEWLQVAESVGHAYAHIKTGGADSKAHRKLEKAIAKIEKMDLLTDEQKKKLIGEVREKAAVVLEAPPPQNIALVQPRIGEIEAVVK